MSARMTIYEYLSEKYGVRVPTTLLGCEARVFGIPYPLRSGWLLEHGHREITPEMVARLKVRLQIKGNGSAPRALEVLRSMQGA